MESALPSAPFSIKDYCELFDKNSGLQIWPKEHVRIGMSKLMRLSRVKEDTTLFDQLREFLKVPSSCSESRKGSNSMPGYVRGLFRTQILGHVWHDRPSQWILLLKHGFD